MEEQRLILQFLPRFIALFCSFHLFGTPYFTFFSCLHRPLVPVWRIMTSENRMVYTYTTKIKRADTRIIRSIANKVVQANMTMVCTAALRQGKE